MPKVRFAKQLRALRRSSAALLQRRGWDEREAAGFAVEAAEFDFV